MTDPEDSLINLLHNEENRGFKEHTWLQPSHSPPWSIPVSFCSVQSETLGIRSKSLWSFVRKMRKEKLSLLIIRGEQPNLYSRVYSLFIITSLPSILNVEFLAAIKVSPIYFLPAFISNYIYFIYNLRY